MAQKHSKWWPVLGVALGVATWLTQAAVWLGTMALLYGVYTALGTKALFAGVLCLFAVLLHFQLTDIEQGSNGDYMRKWVLAVCLFIYRRISRR